MGLNVYVGSFTQKTSTGSQSTTGVGFQPKVVFFFGSMQTTDASGADCVMTFGAATSSSDRRCMAIRSLDVTSSTYVYANNTKALVVGAKVALADLTSMDADGFTLNYSAADATARVINFIALGGTDLTNVKTGEETSKTSGGTKATTGLGFAPTCLLTFFPVNGTNPTSDGLTNIRGTMGFATSAANQGDFGFYDNGGAASRRSQSTSKVISQHGTSMTMEAALSSFDADGFTLNWTTSPGSANYFYYVALAGPNVKVGNFTQATGTGNQSTTGVGFAPSVLMLLSDNNVSSASIITSLRNSNGAGTSATSRFSNWVGIGDGTTDRSQDMDRTKIIKMMTNASSSPTTQAAADLVSLDSDGFTLNWTIADATARQINYLALGAPASVVSTDTIMPQIWM